jgi:hypothetical protein
LSSTEVIQRAAAPALQMEIPTAAAAPTLQVEIPTAVAAPALQVEISTSAAEASSLQADLDMAVEPDARSLDSKAARILPEAVAATWVVHRLREILPIASRVPGYSE